MWSNQLHIPHRFWCMLAVFRPKWAQFLYQLHSFGLQFRPSILSIYVQRLRVKSFKGSTHQHKRKNGTDYDKHFDFRCVKTSLQIQEDNDFQRKSFVLLYQTCAIKFVHWKNL